MNEKLAYLIITAAAKANRDYMLKTKKRMTHTEYQELIVKSAGVFRLVIYEIIGMKLWKKFENDAILSTAVNLKNKKKKKKNTVTIEVSKSSDSDSDSDADSSIYDSDSSSDYPRKLISLSKFIFQHT